MGDRLPGNPGCKWTRRARGYANLSLPVRVLPSIVGGLIQRAEGLADADYRPGGAGVIGLAGNDVLFKLKRMPCLVDEVI